MTNGAMRIWLLNTFTVNNIINESRSLSRRILFENVPSGQKYLTSIIEAMQKNLEIRLVHESYWHDGPSAYTVQPWCLKIFNQRWYVSGHCHERNGFRTFALDRIQELTVLDTVFEYPRDFNAEEYFADFFGIITSSEIGKETIRIKAYGLQVNYPERDRERPRRRMGRLRIPPPPGHRLRLRAAQARKSAGSPLSAMAAREHSQRHPGNGRPV